MGRTSVGQPCECGCGEITTVKAGRAHRFRQGHHIRVLDVQSLPAWKGGSTKESHGYVLRFLPGHERANGRGYVLEHLLIVERAIGRGFPRTAEVHHVDEDKANNAGGNLVLCQDRAYHKLLHARQRALDACGNASARPCNFCHSYDRQEEVIVTRHGTVFHAECKRSYQRDWARRARES